VIRLLLDADAARGRIRSVMISGDFFASPPRSVYDLESRFKDTPPGWMSSTEFSPSSSRPIRPRRLLGPGDFAQVFRKALEKMPYLNLGFSFEETNDLSRSAAASPMSCAPSGLVLLPYCAKDLDCALRQQDGCLECSQCSIGEGYAMARAHDLQPITIVSFENLQANLRRITLKTAPASSVAAARASTPSMRGLRAGGRPRRSGQHG